MTELTNIRLDDIDRQLIAALQVDARESAAMLARKLGIARTTVISRIARLEKSKVITGYGVRLGQRVLEGGLQAYVGNLARQLVLGSGRAADEVALRLEVDALEVGVEAAVPLGLLVTELVTNAYKHAFPHGRRGQVVVSIRQVPEGGVRVAVADDGVGLPPGFEPSCARSLGLQLAAALARQLGGELSFARDGGTTASVVVPRL